MNTNYESLIQSAQENYRNFFAHYNESNYKNALVDARIFIEFIVKACIFEICDRHYKNKLLFQQLNNKGQILIQHNHKDYYIIKHDDINNAKNGENDTKKANGNILKGNGLEISQIDYCAIKNSSIFKFESSDLIKILGAFIVQIDQKAYYNFKTSYTSLSDIFKKANPGAHSSHRSVLEKAANDVNFLLQPCTYQLMRFCEDYAQTFLCDTAIFLKGLIANTQSTNSSSSTPPNKLAQQNHSYNGYSKQTQNATADINKHKEEELRRQKEENTRKRQEKEAKKKKQKEDNELEQAFNSLLADYNSQQEEGPEKRQEETEKDKHNYDDDSQIFDEALSFINEILKQYSEKLKQQEEAEGTRYLCIAKVDDKYGFIDRYGFWVIKPQFDYVLDFHKGFAYLDIESSPVNVDGKWGIIDREGNWFIHPKYDDYSYIYEGWAILHDNHGYFYVSEDGHKRLNDESFEDANAFSEGLASVKINGKYGFIDKSGNIVINPNFEDANAFSEGLAYVKINGKYGFIDKSGNIVINPNFEDANAFSEGLASVEINGKYGFIDKSGNIVINPNFEDANAFSEGLASVMINGKYGFIDKTGKIVITPQFDDVESFHDITKSQEHYCLY